ncbi:MAG TPA: hypothetical protein VK607_04535, partial [Kofleriaceae bacterium]|nr:hypothetical protein [Kofleriaceae bacterium]
MAVGLSTGCPDRSIDEVLPQQGRVEAKDIPVNVNRDVDLLFLIDDSPSMKDKQNNLADNFKEFINVLKQIPGGLPNVHIGITTSDVGTKGALDTMPGPAVPPLGMGGCSGVGKNGNLQTYGAPVTGVFISAISGQMPNFTGDLTDVFSSMAKGVEAKGCGFEQHLEAIKLALQPSNPANVGFLRKDAYLAVIIIADEDDCSMAHSSLLSGDTATLGDRQSFRCTRFGVTCDQNGVNTNTMNQTGSKAQCHPNDNSDYLTKVSDYVTFLKGLKDDPRKVIVAGIMGTLDRFDVELRVPSGGSRPIPALAHSCTYIGADNDGDGTPDPELADPPIRLKFFLDQFPNRSTFVSICQKNLAGGLQQIGELLKTVIGDPCIEGKLANVAPPGSPQPIYDCSV